MDKNTLLSSKTEAILSKSGIVRPGIQSDGQTDPCEQTDEEVARNAREIEQQSAVIQKELEAERKMRNSCSSLRGDERSSARTAGKNVEFELTPAGNDRDIDMKWRELNRLDENIKGCHADLKRLETLVKERREQAEDARTQLMLTEFKRNNAVKELEKLSQELYVKRNKVKAFEDEVKVKLEQIKQIDSLGITVEEVQALMQDRELYESRVRHLDAVQLERNELLRQLDSVKEALFAERKNARSESEELLEETENVKTKLEEIQGERDELHQRLVATEMALQKMEKEKAVIVKEKAQAMKNVQEKAKQEAFNLQRQTERENERQSLKFGEMAAQILRLEEDVRARDEAILHLRGQLESAAQKLLEEHQKREGMEADHRKTLQCLRKDTDTALKQVREACFLDKQQALEGLRSQLEEEKKESLLKCEDRMTRRLAELEEKSAAKDDQIQKLEDQVRQIQEESRKEIEKIRESSAEQAQAVIRKERQVFENERDWLKQREREAASSDMKRKLTSITEELECRNAQVKQLQEELLRLEKDLEEQKSLARESVKDKLLAVARVKEQARTDRQMDMESLRDTVVKENKAEIQNLSEMIDRQGEELKKLRSAKLTNEKENSSALDRTERTLIHEINEECRRTAEVLGLAPRKINLANFRSDRGSDLSANSQQGYGRKVTTSALANLRACNEELRSQVVEMSQMMESQQSALLYAQRDKEDAIDQVKKKMEQEKLREMDSLKERLIRDHVEEINKMMAAQSRDKTLQRALWQKENIVSQMKHDVRLWKEDVTQKFAAKLQQELQKRQKKQADCQQSLERVNATQQCEIDRLEREVARLAQNQNRLLTQVSKAKTDSNGGYSSRPDRDPRQMSPSSQQSYSSTNHLAEAYERRAKHAEKEAEFAESRANRNESLLAQKMTDMNNLQSTLTHQSKELRQLERAYNQLRNHSQHLSRSSCPSLLTRPGSAPLFTDPTLSFSGPSSSFSSPAPCVSSATPIMSVPTSSFPGRAPSALRRPVSLTTL